jgi:2-haloacid dehalogenase
MVTTLAFDVYGTLIDTHGVVVELEKYIGVQAMAFSSTWRDKQLEYSFRRGLMRQYENFSVCTKDAFEFTCAYYKVQLDPHSKLSILEAYNTLPAFFDVKDGLERMGDVGSRLYAFSNGSREIVSDLLSNADLMDYFMDVVSVDEIRSYKPDPAVYRHFLDRAETTANRTWLVSSNPFDVVGALSSGMRAAWLKRSDAAVFDPWGIEPTITINSLLELAPEIAKYQK